MPDGLTIVYPYYDNPSMLELHIFEWLEYRETEKAAVRVVIVDDGSPNFPAYNVLRPFHESIGFEVRLFRIKENKPWNQDGARNLAMKNVPTQWALMTDMDHLVGKWQLPGLMKFVSQKAERGNYYMPQRVRVDGTVYHRHPNSFLFNVADFWEMGGYDEDFAGAYGSDGNFRKCCRGAGLKERELNGFDLKLYSDFDVPDCNTRDWGRKDSIYHRSHFPILEQKMKGPPYKAVHPIRFQWEQQL